ncbi:hypothetical protein EC968_002126 [Mortierella alpina]|nr:hypothetical protein EC968_002126 [Mortierella alpina]
MVRNRCQEQQALEQGSASTASTDITVSSTVLGATDTTHHGHTSSEASTDVDMEGGSSCSADSTALKDGEVDEPQRRFDKKGRSVIRTEDQEKSTPPSKDAATASSRSTVAIAQRRGIVDNRAITAENQETAGVRSSVGAGDSRGSATKSETDGKDDNVEREEELAGEREVTQEDKEAVEAVKEQENEDDKSEGAEPGPGPVVCSGSGVGSRSATVEDEEHCWGECADECERGCGRQTAEKRIESDAEGKRSLCPLRDEGDRAKDDNSGRGRTQPCSCRAVALPSSLPRPALRGTHTASAPSAIPGPADNLPVAPRLTGASLPAANRPVVRSVPIACAPPNARPVAPTYRAPAASLAAPVQLAPTQVAAVSRPSASKHASPAQAPVTNASAAFLGFRFVRPVIQPRVSRRGNRAAHTQSQRRVHGASFNASTGQSAAGNTGATTRLITAPAPTSHNSVISAVAAVAAGSSGLPPIHPFTFTAPVGPPANLPPSAPVAPAFTLGAPSTAANVNSMVATTSGPLAGSNAASAVPVSRVLQAHKALRADRRQRSHAQWVRNEQFRRQQAQTLQAIIQEQERHRQLLLLQKQEEEKSRVSKLQAIQQMFADGVRRQQAHGPPPTPFVYPSYVDNMWVHWSPATALAPAKKALLSKHGSPQTSDVRKKQRMFKSTWKKLEIRPSKYPYRSPGHNSAQPRPHRVKKICAPRMPARRPVQRTDPPIAAIPVIQTNPVMQQSWPSTFYTANVMCTHAPSTPILPSAPILSPATHQPTATTIQGDTDMQLSSQAAIQMWKYIPLHPDPLEATRLAFLNLCAAHGRAGFTFSGAVLEYGWTHLSQCLPSAGQVGGEVAARNAQTVVDLKRTMRTWRYEPLHPDATTAAALAHMDFDAANKAMAGSFGAMLMAMGRQHMDSCLAQPMDWMRSPAASASFASSPSSTAVCPPQSQFQPQPQPPSQPQPQTAAHSSINPPTRLLVPSTTALASAPCTVAPTQLASVPLAPLSLASAPLAPAPLAPAPLAPAPLAPRGTLAAPTQTSPTHMHPLPALPVSISPGPSAAAAAHLPQIAVTAASTSTADAAAASSVLATLGSPAGRWITFPPKAPTLDTPFAPLTPQQPAVPLMSISTSSTLVRQPQPSSAPDNGIDGSRTVSASDSEGESASSGSSSDAENLKPEHGEASNRSRAASNSSDSSGSDSTASLTSTSVTGDSEFERDNKKLMSSGIRRQKLQLDRNRRQRHLRERVLGSPIFDMMKLGLAKLLPKGKRLLKQGLGRGAPRLENLGHDGHVDCSGNSSCSTRTRSTCSSDVKRIPGRAWRHPSLKESTYLTHINGGNSDVESNNSEDSGYHPSRTLSTGKHNSNADASTQTTGSKSFAPALSPVAVEPSTKNQKRTRPQQCDDNEQIRGSGGDDADDEKRPFKRRLKRRRDGDTKDDSDRRRRIHGFKCRSRRQRATRKSHQTGGTFGAFDCPPDVVSKFSFETTDTSEASITPTSPGATTKTTPSADGLTRAVQRLRRVIDAVPKNIEVCTPSDLELERTRLLNASAVVFYNQARQHNPPGSTNYTPVPTPSSPTRKDMASYTLPSAESVSYAPDPEDKDVNLGLMAAEAAHSDFLKAQSYHITYNLPDRLQPLRRSGIKSELKTMMDQNSRKRRAAAEDIISDRRDDSMAREGDDNGENNEPRKLKSR